MCLHSINLYISSNLRYKIIVEVRIFSKIFSTLFFIKASVVDEYHYFIELATVVYGLKIILFKTPIIIMTFDMGRL